MNGMILTAARVMIPLAVGAFVTGGAAAKETKIEELKEYCGEINEIVNDAHGYLVANQVALLDKKNNCQKLVFGLTGEALKDVATKGIGASVLNDLKDGLKAAAKTLLPEASLGEVAEKVAEKVAEAAKKEAEKRLKDAIKKFFDDNPVIKKYTASGTVLGCSYTTTVSWDLNGRTFFIRTTGDCKCQNVKTANGEGKIGQWQSMIKGTVVVNASKGVDGFVTGLDVNSDSYSGAGSCACEVKEVKTKPRKKKTGDDASYTAPSDGFAISIGIGGGGGERRGRDHDRDVGRSSEPLRGIGR
jgi:hypothetical protein